MSGSPDDPALGMVIGPYRIVREIGGGGMGVVYEAADDGLNRNVALKVISPHLAHDAEFRARFAREAQALAALDSPHVLHVYAYGEVDGRLYLATQLMPDGDLGAMLRGFGPPLVPVAVDLITQAAAGLADAHEAGLIHRDLKPANILLRRRGDTLLASLGDFGIARRLDAEQTDATRAGIAGTPSYLAPELHTGAAAGVASDLYSLGCLLWATLSGSAPYRGTTDYQIIHAHLEQPIPQLPGRSALVVEVNRILRTAMAKDPADRYDSASQLRDDLRRTSSLSEAEGIAGSSRRTRAIVVGVIGVLVVATTILWGLSGGEEEPVARQVPPSASSAPSLTPEPTPQPTPSGSDRARAEAGLAAALRAQGFTEEQADCAARDWIDSVGLDAIVDEGLFDRDFTFVDRPASSMSPEMASAASAATVGCVI